MPDRTANTLMPIIQQFILPGSTVISDQWRAYNNVGNQGFNQLMVNHLLNFVDLNTGAHTQSVESIWSGAKICNNKVFGTHCTLLDSYLCEYMWHRRTVGRNRFDTILQNIVDFWSPT